MWQHPYVASHIQQLNLDSFIFLNPVQNDTIVYLNGAWRLVSFPTPTPPTGDPLTSTNDTNVTISLGGSPTTALLAPVSLTLGWTGTLADARITSATNWNTAYNDRIASLTTLGTSGASTLIANVLNIPQYQAAGSYVPTTRNLTINGTTFDLSIDRTWNVGTVISVGTGTGLTGGTITSSGSISLDSKLSPLDSLTGNSLKLVRVNSGETAVEYFTPTYGTGTVTSVDVSGGTTGLSTSGGPITASGTITLNGTLITSNGGTGLSSFTQGDILYYNSGTLLSKLAKDTNTTRYLSNQGTSNNPSWNQVNLTNGVTGVLPSANGGSDGWVDYSATSTIVGWGSFTEKKIFYKVGYKQIFVKVVIAGVSNSATTTFTLPTAAGASPSFSEYLSYIADNNTPNVGLYELPASSTVVTVYRYPTITSLSATWTNSGNKAVYISFWYGVD